MNGIRNRETWLDNVRTVSCLMVIIVHVTVLYKYIYGSVDNVYWYLTVFLDSASRMCVPLFFMVSGYIFLSDKSVRAKNALKIFTALTFYSVISVLYYVFFTGGNFINLIVTLYSKPEMYHLWFMFYLFTFYIMFYLIKVRELNPNIALIIIVLLFTVFNYKLNDISSLFGFEIKNGFYIRSDYFHLFLYTVAGAYIARVEENRTFFLFAFIVMIASVAGITLLTIVKSEMVGKFDAVFQTYTSVPVFLSAVSMFYVIRYAKLHGKLASCSKLISKNSLAIYGIHAVILEIIRNRKLFLSENPAINMLFTYIIVFGFSLVLAVAIKKIDRKGFVS